MTFIVLWVLLMLLFFFVMTRHIRKQQKENEQQLDAVFAEFEKTVRAFCDEHDRLKQSVANAKVTLDERDKL